MCRGVSVGRREELRLLDARQRASRRPGRRGTLPSARRRDGHHGLHQGRARRYRSPYNTTYDTIRYDTIDDLHWKTDMQAASLIQHMNYKKMF